MNGFVYKLVETDLQKLYESTDYIKTLSFNAFQSAVSRNDKVCESTISDLRTAVNKLGVEMADLVRRINRMKEDAAKMAAASESSQP